VTLCSRSSVIKQILLRTSQLNLSRKAFRLSSVACVLDLRPIPISSALFDIEHFDDHEEIKVSRERAEATWKAATTYEELLRLNRAFLRGEINTIPTHGAPLSPDSASLITNLVRLLEYGAYTESCQPFIHDVSRDGSAERSAAVDHQPQQCTDEPWLEHRQRVYLNFKVASAEPRVDPTAVRRLLEAMKKHPNV